MDVIVEKTESEPFVEGINVPEPGGVSAPCLAPPAPTVTVKEFPINT
jgi:hypothetical protein